VSQTGAPLGVVSVTSCKKDIRLQAQPGDVVVGLMSLALGNLCGRKPYTMIWCGTISKKLTLQEYARLYTNRRDCIYTTDLQHIENLYHPATDLENIRKDKEGKFALIFTDVHRFDKEIFGQVLLDAKKLTREEGPRRPTRGRARPVPGQPGAGRLHRRRRREQDHDPAQHPGPLRRVEAV
jgi:hypothetical protein